MNLAGFLFRSLQEAGVTLAFGCGDADAFLWEAARDAGLRTAAFATGSGALGAAGAYRQATGGVAAVLGTDTMVAALGDPSRSRCPLCVIVGTGLRRAPKDGPALRVAVRLDDAGKAPGLVREAVAAAVGGRDGPVLVALGREAAGAEVDPRHPHEPLPAGGPAPPVEAIEEASLLLSLAARPVVWAGAGAVAARASHELAEVADLLGAPVVTSTSGKGAVGEAHPLALGSVFDVPEVARMLGAADAALAVGTTFSARSTRRWRLALPMQLIHVDVDTGEAGRRYPTRLAIAGDARVVLGALVAELRARSAGEAREAAPEDARQEARRQVRALREAALQRLRPAAAPAGPALHALRRAIPEEVPTVWDVSPSRWAVPLFEVPVGGTFHAPGAGAGPGSSLAGAVGVAAAGRGPVVAVMAAGELLACCHDLAAIAGASLPVVAVAFEGAVWAGAPPSPAPDEPPSRLRIPDLAGLAGAFGVPAVEAAGIGDLEAAIGRAMATSGPTLVAVA